MCGALGTMKEPIPDERPQRRREYSGAGSTLGLAMLIVLVVGVGLWFFEFRDNTSSGGRDSTGMGVIDLPAGLNTTGKKPVAEVGRAAPNFKLTAPDGSVATLDSFRGKYVLVNFWASWCQPCRNETPALQKLFEDGTAKSPGLVVLGVNQQEDGGAATAFVREYGVTYPVLLDRSGGVSQGYRVSTGLPNSFLVDPDGVIQQIFVRALTSEDLAKIEQGVS